MPYTINGVGTWYYGKNNLFSHAGTCEFCKNYTELSSYDTALYFTLFYIPIIPLGKKRLLNYCPKCSKHRVVELKEWGNLKQKNIEEALKRFYDNTGSAENAANLIETLFAYQDEKKFLEVAESIKQQHKNNLQIQFMLADAYSYFSHLKEAESAYRQVLSLQDNPLASKALAVNLIKQLKPEQAYPYLEFILNKSVKEDIGYLYLLIEAYQAKGKHSEALNLLRSCERIFKGITSDKAYKKYRKISERNLGGKKVVKSAMFCMKQKKTPAGDGFFPGAHKFVGPLILLVLLAGYLITAYVRGKAVSMYVLNGLGRSYDIQINNKRFTLPAQEHIRVKMLEGNILVKVLDEDLNISQQTTVIKTSFFARPFLNRTYVINPDRVAVLLWERTQYSAEPAQNIEKLPYKYYTGEFFYSFAGIDYKFSEFPNRIDISSKTSRVEKERITQVKDLLSSNSLIDILTEDLGVEKAREFLKTNLYYDPQNGMSIYYLSVLSEPKDMIDFLRPNLARRPVLIEYHRMYQDLMDVVNREYNLEQEYRGYLEKDKSNPELIYLLGRVTPDIVESEKLFLQSVTNETPCPYGYNALAYNRLCSGKFEEAARFINKALQIMPDNQSFDVARWEISAALGEFGELLKKIRKEKKDNPYDGEVVAGEIYYLIRNGQKDLVKAVVDGYLSKIKEVSTAELIEEWKNYFDFVYYYVFGDEKLSLEKIKGLSDPKFKFMGEFLAGNLAEAENALKEEKFVSADYHLLLFIAGKIKGDKEFSDKHLRQAIEILEQSSPPERVAADYLKGIRYPDIAEVVQLPISPGQKRIILATIGIQFPEHKEKMFSLGKKLNYHTLFPYLFLKRIFDGVEKAMEPAEIESGRKESL